MNGKGHKMEIIIGSDHAGYIAKEKIKEYFSKVCNSEYKFLDVGCYSPASVDYPDIAKKVVEEMEKKDSLGILVCATGIGMSIAANKFKDIRAALCYDEDAAKMSRQHNDANVLCLGAKLLRDDKILKIADIWLKTPFSKEERHERRINKIKEMEK
jgi:ribose 5-phosphate isomerase B